MSSGPPQVPPSAARPDPRLVAWVAAWCVVATATSVVLFTSSGHDDAYITYWSAWALHHVGSLVNYNGDRLEQSSALLTTLVLAALDAAAPRVGLHWWGFVVSHAANVATVALTTMYAERMARGGGWFAAPLVGTCTALVYWAGSGMETTLAAAAQVATALALAEVAAGARDPTQEPLGRRATALAAVGAGMALATARPEGPVVLACALVVAFAWVAWQRDRAAAVVLAGTALALVGAVIGLVTWRLWAFGEPLPHPAIVKAADARWLSGVRYLGRHLQWAPAIALLGTLGATQALRGPHRAVAAGLVVANAVFVARTGGDWMEIARFVAPALGVAGALAGAWLADRRRDVGIGMAGLACAVQLGMSVYATQDESSGRTFWTAGPLHARLQREVQAPVSWLDAANAGHARDVILVPELERTLHIVRRDVVPADRPIVLFSGQAGMVPYLLFRRAPAPYGPLFFVDACSLTTADVNPFLDPKGLRASSVGVRWNVTRWLAAEERIRAATGLSPPDVLWDSGQRPPPAATGYVVVWRLPGSDGIASAWIAVRADHAHAFPAAASLR